MLQACDPFRDRELAQRISGLDRASTDSGQRISVYFGRDTDRYIFPGIGCQPGFLIMDLESQRSLLCVLNDLFVFHIAIRSLIDLTDLRAMFRAVDIPENDLDDRRRTKCTGFFSLEMQAFINLEQISLKYS